MCNVQRIERKIAVNLALDRLQFLSIIEHINVIINEWMNEWINEWIENMFHCAPEKSFHCSAPYSGMLIGYLGYFKIVPKLTG